MSRARNPLWSMNVVTGRGLIDVRPMLSSSLLLLSRELQSVVRREIVLEVVSNGEGMRGILSGDGDDDLSMVGRNDVEQFSFAVLARDESIVRDGATKVEMNILHRMSILDQENQSIPELLQLVDRHSIGGCSVLLGSEGSGNFLAVEDAELDQKLAFDAHRQFQAFQVDQMRTVNGQIEIGVVQIFLHGIEEKRKNEISSRGEMSIGGNEFVLTTRTDDRHRIDSMTSVTQLFQIDHRNAKTHFTALDAKVLTDLPMKSQFQFSGMRKNQLVRWTDKSTERERRDVRTLDVFGWGIEIGVVSHFVPIVSQFTDIDTLEVFDERMKGHPEDAVAAIVTFVEQFATQLRIVCPQPRLVRPFT